MQQYPMEKPSLSRSRGSSLFPETVEELFDRFWRSSLAAPEARETWQAPCDIIETSGEYVLYLDLPGVRVDDVDVTLTGDTLTIRGEKKPLEKGADDAWLLSERAHGRFERKFSFPSPVAADGVTAEAVHGTLVVRLAKAEEARPHKIRVKSSR